MATNRGTRALISGLSAMGFALTAAAQDAGRITFYQDAQPILNANCVTCHKPAGNNVMGMVAPMPLRSYREVRPWAKAIAREVKAQTMPPWHASPEFHGVFENERTLTEKEIGTLVRWAETGGARGKGQDTEVYADDESGGWTIGKPDLIIPFKEPYWVADRIQDHYETITVQLTKEEMPKDRWIKSMQFKPGSEAVHHIVIFTSGYRESMGIGVGMLGGMGPGTDATIFPDGYGRFFEAESMIMFNMHYHKEAGPGTGVWDRSEIAFVFQDTPVHHSVSWGAVGTMNLSIPPYASNYEVVAQETMTRDTTLLALFPHTHLRGSAAKYTAYYPSGEEEVLLHVPNYDFNWQTNYVFKEPKKVPKGTRIKVQMWYENTEERAEYTGIDPSKTVHWGQPTTAEMMYGWIDYADTKPMTD